ncbi:hypothetical protein K438DRAFT_1980917 [Mycena galopus ATCC 62051]|nr:hypothetical protein K438DRAFT_1980917 [Mycena galopus ATCC 62051]
MCHTHVKAAPELDHRYLRTTSTWLAAGAVKLRANFTDKNHAGNFTSLSDESYIATESPCVGFGPARSAAGTASALSNRTISSIGSSVAFVCLLGGAAAGIAG